jgi:hypothetical protein
LKFGVRKTPGYRRAFSRSTHHFIKNAVQEHLVPGKNGEIPSFSGDFQRANLTMRDILARGHFHNH